MKTRHRNYRGGRGMVLGKFMPPHKGHLYLIDFARNYVSDLTVVVGTLPSEPIEGALRYTWMCELVPDARVVHLPDDLPQEPSQHPEFWSIWQAALKRVLPLKPLDFVFASENYGYKLAEVLGAEFVPVDITRTAVPVSGTAIRHEPYDNWDYLPACVQAYYVKKVCVFGPESTGKTTLAKDLAKAFATVWVPEYARLLLEEHQGKLTYTDIPKIAKGQLAAEEALARQANKLLFCDTDLLTTSIWSEVLFGRCPEWIKKEANQRTYDLYLLCDVDVPFVDDLARYLPEERQSFYDLCKAELDQRSLKYVEIRGNWEERWQLALKGVTEVLWEGVGTVA